MICRVLYPCSRCMSLPVWGAWIEINYKYYYAPYKDRRSPYGERGLKSARNDLDELKTTVAPRMGSVD